MLSAQDLKAMIREIPDWPKPGISFKDITTVLRDGAAWHSAISQLAELCRPFRPEVIVAPEARGFIIGSALAYALGAGCVPVRKRGKLPWETVRGEYLLEYGADVLEIHRDAVRPGARVLVVDDVLATGGTLAATIDLVEQIGGTVVGAALLIELTYLPGREKLSKYPVVSLIQY
ncbi:MAG: adenine phosphoribosyltransferase [Firmicutes bacterium]|nr:adenine phosphoribosyltransferase [Bacillota bacterium]